MKRTAAILSAMLIGTAMASYPALAQSSSGSSNSMNTDSNQMKTDTSGSMDQNSMGSTDTMTTGSTNGGSAMTNDEIVGKLKTADVASVNIVSMSDTQSDNTAGRSAPPNTTPQEQQKLQAAVKSNSKLMSALQEKSVKPSQVMAANVGADNTVTLYVK